MGSKYMSGDDESINMTFRLPKKLRDEAKALAEKDHRSLSSLIRIAIRGHLAK